MRIDPAQSTWDELAAAAAAVEDAAAVTALRGVVAALESAAGAPRWSLDDEPLVVLQRRFASGQRRLVGTGSSVEELERHLVALCGAARPAGRPVEAVPAGAVRAVPARC